MSPASAASPPPKCGASAAAAKVPDLTAPCHRTVFFFEFCVSVFFFLFILSPFFFVVPPACQGRLILFIFPIPSNIHSFFAPSPRKSLVLPCSSAECNDNRPSSHSTCRKSVSVSQKGRGLSCCPFSSLTEDSRFRQIKTFTRAVPSTLTRAGHGPLKTRRP